MIKRLSAKSFVVEDMSTLTSADYSDFAIYCVERKIGFDIISRFVAFLGKQERSDQLEFFKKLDYPHLSKDATESKSDIIAIYKFVNTTKKAGMFKHVLIGFARRLDFALLGALTHKDCLDPTSISQFVRSIYRLGDFAKEIKIFYGELDFESMGKQITSSKISILTVNELLRGFNKFRVETKKQSVFCEQLDFPMLGKFADEKGIYAIDDFLSFTHGVGIPEKRHSEFFTSLGLKKLGTSVSDRVDCDPFIMIFQFVICEAFIESMAREFFEGIGWIRFRALCDASSPDRLAVLIAFLDKCNFDQAELSAHDFESFSEPMFNAFITKPCNHNRLSMMHQMRRQIDYSLRSITSTDFHSRISSAQFKLRDWNVLLHNLKIMRASNLIETAGSVLKSFSATDFNKLFSDSDLRNISTFHGHFSSYQGLFDWQLPRDIDYVALNLSSTLKRTNLLELAHTLFSFCYINRLEVGSHYAIQFADSPDMVLQLMQRADLRAIDFFMWNLFIMLPAGKKPDLFENPKFLKKIIQKSTEKHAQRHLLGIVGTIRLSGSSVDTGLISALSIKEAKRLCQEAADSGDVRLYRLVGGLWAVDERNLDNRKKVIYLGALRALTAKLSVETPNQRLVVNQLVDWLNIGLEKNRKRHI